MSFLCILCMELEIIMLSKMSQTQKDKSCMFFSYAKSRFKKKRYKSTRETIWEEEGDP
jgi:hypothetical protein